MKISLQTNLFLWALIAITIAIHSSVNAHAAAPSAASVFLAAETQADEKADEKDDEKADEKKSEKTPRRSTRSSRYSKSASDFVSVFSPAIASVTPATVIVTDGKRQIALGTIVGSEGLVLTKASELKGKVTCELADGRKLLASIQGIDPKTDLALLKIEAKDLVVATINPSAKPKVGAWVVTVGPDETPLTVGVVGCNSRKIKGSRAMMGVFLADLEPGKKGVRINQVTANSPAERANILVNDIITAIDGKETPDRSTLQETVAAYSPGDRITITILRRRKEIEISLTLGDGNKINPMMDRSNQQNRMGSTLSSRRNDFELAMQHDSPLQAKQCGGPLVDLSGNVVGINIARSGRVDSLALPSEVVLPILQELKTGNMLPAIVNKEKLDRIEAELAALVTADKDASASEAEMKLKFETQKAREEELAKMLKDIESRLEELKDSKSESEKELKSLKAKIEKSQKSRERLEADRKRLSTGVR